MSTTSLFEKLRRNLVDKDCTLNQGKTTTMEQVNCFRTIWKVTIKIHYNIIAENCLLFHVWRYKRNAEITKILSTDFRHELLIPYQTFKDSSTTFSSWKNIFILLINICIWLKSVNKFQIIKSFLANNWVKFTLTFNMS